MSTLSFYIFVLLAVIFSIFEVDSVIIAGRKPRDLHENDNVENIRSKRSLIKKYGNFDFESYHDYPIIEEFIVNSCRRYSNICSIKNVGTTFEKRNLYILKIGVDGPLKKHIWVDGGIHAREWISPAAVTYIVNKLLTQWTNLPDYIQNTVWHIMPVVNPDGYAFSHTKNNRFWRKNRKQIKSCFGVDINRNFPYKFGGKGTSSSPCSEIYRGPKPFSEEEAIAMSNYLTNLPTVPTGFLTYHSYGMDIMHPYGYDNVNASDAKELIRVANKAIDAIKAKTDGTFFVGPGNMAGFAAGASDDWAKAILGVKYVYTVELRDVGDFGFELPASDIVVGSREAFIIASTLAENVQAYKGN